MRAQAMVATADLHSADEAAKRVIPGVAPLAMDPIAEVRTHALVALDRYSKILKEEHARLLAAAAAGGAPDGEAHMDGAPSGLRALIGRNAALRAMELEPYHFDIAASNGHAPSPEGKSR